MYIKIDDDIYIEYDTENDKATVLSKSAIETELAEAKTRLAAIPAGPTDEELLAWARANYPQMDYSQEKAYLQSVIDLNSARKAGMK